MSPIFEHICLKLGEKSSQLTLLSLAFDGFTLRDASDLVLNSTGSSRIVFCAVIDGQDNWCSAEFIFKMAERRADVALSKKLEILKNCLALPKCKQRASAEQLNSSPSTNA